MINRAILKGAAITALAGLMMIGVANPAFISEAGPLLAQGQEYRVGEIKITGAKTVAEPFLRGALGLVSGGVFNESNLRKGFDELRRTYGRNGHINFTAIPTLDFDEAKKVVNLTINIDEGRQFTVNRITFTGNTATRDEVIRRELMVAEGNVFDSALWEISLLRLNQLRLFEDIKTEDVLIKASPDKPTIDIELRVKEKGR